MKRILKNGKYEHKFHNSVVLPKHTPLAKNQKNEIEIFQQNQSAALLNSEPDQCAAGCVSLY